VRARPQPAAPGSSDRSAGLRFHRLRRLSPTLPQPGSRAETCIRACRGHPTPVASAGSAAHARQAERCDDANRSLPLPAPRGCLVDPVKTAAFDLVCLPGANCAALAMSPAASLANQWQRSSQVRRRGPACDRLPLAYQRLHIACLCESREPSLLGACVGMTTCGHRAHIKLTRLPESVDGCEECLAAGTPWLHLRICLACGHVACCDESPHRHAHAHAKCKRPPHHPIA
jgi:hypothetical protein